MEFESAYLNKINFSYFNEIFKIHLIMFDLIFMKFLLTLYHIISFFYLNQVFNHIVK